MSYLYRTRAYTGDAHTRPAPLRRELFRGSAPYQAIPTTAYPPMPLRTHTLKTMTLAVCAAALAACSDVVEDTRPGQPVKHRQEAFKDILRVFEPMGTMLRTNSYDADRFALMAEALLERRDGPWSFFADDTYYPPTKAREAVWTRPDDFEDHLQAFVEATDELFEAAQARELARVRSAYDTAYGSCRNCHEEFRKR